MPLRGRLVVCVGTVLLSTAGLLVAADGPPAAAAPTTEVRVQPVHRVGAAGVFPADQRLKPLRTLRDHYHPWTPPATLAEWEQTRDRIREQILISCGLWPLPDRTPLQPVVHGLVDRDDYTVERVYFASRPGVYVTGSLYRPKGAAGRRPGILCPHGHWPEGRFYDAGDKDAAKQIETGAETRSNAAHSPLQARMVQLARMGCVVFHYDMIGYADNGPLDHRLGFSDAQAELLSQNILGLQTWNSIRALDFLESLPDVDPQRIGVTGASGGGTQTFLLCAIDPRPAVAFPAVMVSTNMQGGCVCENASLLRLGLNNVAFAACFAPKPLAMTGADDWTIDIETRGLPELRQVWSLYGQPELVAAQCFPQFGHNYNEVARKVMYEWFNRHLHLGLPSPIEERDYVPLSREEMTVFTADHPRPGDALPAAALRERLTDESRAWFSDLLERSSSDPAEYQRIVGAAADFLLGSLPAADGIQCEETGTTEIEDGKLTRGWCTRASDGARIPWVRIDPREPQGQLTLWIDGRGKQGLFDEQGRPISAVRQLLKNGRSVLSGDVFLTGEFLPTEFDTTLPVNRSFAGYTYGYNRTLLTERVRDVLTLAACGSATFPAESIDLVGTRAAGPWVLLARGRWGQNTGRCTVDLDGFACSQISRNNDPNFLPAALKFGGLGGLAAASGPITVDVHGASDAVKAELEPLTRLGGTVNYRNQRLSPSSED